MQIKFILLCLIAHVIGDYYLQDDEMAELKKEKILGVITHSMFYSIPFVIIFILFQKSYKLIWILILLCLSHLIIDAVKFYCYKGYLKVINTDNKKKKVKNYIRPWMIYLLDQVLHISSIIGLVFYFRKTTYYPTDILYNMYKVMNINGLIFLKWILMVLCVHKPANITFKVIFSDCKPEVKLDENTDNSTGNNISNRMCTTNSNNGATIGFLERIIISIFLFANQYSAIGFILTAKSIARYNKISEDAEFGEYYLIGTLFSTLFVIVIYNFIFNI